MMCLAVKTHGNNGRGKNGQRKSPIVTRSTQSVRADDTNKRGKKSPLKTTNTSRKLTIDDLNSSDDDEGSSEEYESEDDEEEGDTIYTDCTSTSASQTSESEYSDVDDEEEPSKCNHSRNAPQITLIINGNGGNSDEDEVVSNNHKTLAHLYKDVLSGNDLEEAEHIFMREIYEDVHKKRAFLSPSQPPTPFASSANLSENVGLCLSTDDIEIRMEPKHKPNYELCYRNNW
jgi:hypothetical protein